MSPSSAGALEPSERSSNDNFESFSVAIYVWRERWPTATSASDFLAFLRHIDLNVPAKLGVHHSDQGCQYTSIALGNRCKEAGISPSMGSVGDCYDNAVCESFNAILECELLVQHRFKGAREAALAVFDFIEGFYNTHRRHTAIGSISPAEYEQRLSAA